MLLIISLKRTHNLLQPPNELYKPNPTHAFLRIMSQYHYQTHMIHLFHFMPILMLLHQDQTKANHIITHCQEPLLVFIFFKFNPKLQVLDLIHHAYIKFSHQLLPQQVNN